MDNVVDIVHVVTPVGEIFRKMETLDFGGQPYKVKTFLGIPYAQPQDFAGQFQHRTSRIHFMLQGNDGYIRSHVSVSEDCLFVNIFTPERANGI